MVTKLQIMFTKLYQRERYATSFKCSLFFPVLFQRLPVTCMSDTIPLTLYMLIHIIIMTTVNIVLRSLKRLRLKGGKKKKDFTQYRMCQGTVQER